jgi:hypothetical protein
MLKLEVAGGQEAVQVTGLLQLSPELVKPDLPTSKPA